MIHWHHIAWALAAGCFILAVIGFLGAGMASRALTSEDLRFPRKMLLACVLLILVTLAACTTRSEPAIEVRTVEVVREVQKPCPGKPPVRPAPLGELMATTEAALAQVMAKLGEYSAAGQFADQAMAYVAACPPAAD